MTLAELIIYDEQLNNLICSLETIFQTKKNDKSTNTEMISINEQIDKIKTILNIYFLELHTTPSAEHKKKHSEYKKRYLHLLAETKWLMRHYVIDIQKMSTTELAEYGKSVQNNSLSSLDRTLASIEDSNKVATEVSTQLKVQTEQMAKTQDELEEVESFLESSTKIIKRMLSRVGNDKCIWLFGFLLICAVVIAIVLPRYLK